ncbi:MAG: ankyrin repeat domain-containing protein [Bacteroidales bacterium]|nr:ankyrin repeat domain-containing protein [Bacteroidales bacterium]
MTKRNSLFLALLMSVTFLSFAGPNEDLITACKQGDLAAAKAAIEAGANVNAADASGNTVICNAYFWPDITTLLLEKGADPNGGKYPALISACNVYSTEVVKLLLDAGANPNKPGVSDPGDTFRTLIANEEAKGKKANKVLIKAWENAMAAAQPSKTYAATVLCMQTNHVPAIKMMIEKGMNLEPEGGGNALSTFANYAMSREERKDLFSKSGPAMAGFGLNVPDWYLNLPDDRNGEATDMLELLLGTGIDMNKQDATGFTPLCQVLKGSILAVGPTRQAKIDAGKMMVDKGADVNASSTMTNSNWTYYPLCLATEIGDLSLVKLLVEKGADLNSKVRSGTITLFSSYASVMGEGGNDYTAIIIAIMKDQDEIANYLIEEGADLTIGVHGFATLESGEKGLKCLTIVTNKSPVYWAIERGDNKLVQTIATNLSGKRLPEFTVRQMADVGNADANSMTVRYTCVKFKKSAYPPSEYAHLIGNDLAAGFLAGMKL